MHPNIRHAIMRQFDRLHVQFDIAWMEVSFLPACRTARTHPFERIIRFFDIMKYIADFLDLQTLHSLTSTNQELRRILQYEPSMRARKLLRPYFPDALRELSHTLDISGAIISGSAPLSIIQPGDWTPGDLDIIVPNCNLDIISSFLVTQGFHDVAQPLLSPDSPLVTQTGYHHERDILFNLKRFKRHSLQIDVSAIIARIPSSTPLDFVLTYHSSVVMNILTSSTIYVGFPTLTFAHRLIVNGNQPNMDLLLQKWAGRGYHQDHHDDAAIAKPDLHPFFGTLHDTLHLTTPGRRHFYGQYWACKITLH